MSGWINGGERRGDKYDDMRIQVQSPVTREFLLALPDGSEVSLTYINPFSGMVANAASVVTEEFRQGIREEPAEFFEFLAFAVYVLPVVSVPDTADEVIAEAPHG